MNLKSRSIKFACKICLTLKETREHNAYVLSGSAGLDSSGNAEVVSGVQHVLGSSAGGHAPSSSKSEIPFAGVNYTALPFRTIMFILVTVVVSK